MAPASPPLLPPEYRTQASLRQFIEDDVNNTTWASRRVNRTLFPDPGEEYHDAPGGEAAPVVLRSSCGETWEYEIPHFYSCFINSSSYLALYFSG